MLLLKYESSTRLYVKRFDRQQRSLPSDEKRSISSINRHENEIFITKHTASIFIGPYYGRMARNTGITSIVFSGISTELVWNQAQEMP